MKKFLSLLAVVLILSLIGVPRVFCFNVESKVYYQTSEISEFLSKEPFIIMGSLSNLKKELQDLKEFTNLPCFYDVNLLSKKKQLILIGENYTNLLTLLLELNGNTQVNITEEYPGKGIGIIEFLKVVTNNIYGDEQLMEMLILTGSDAEGTKNAINYFKKIVSGDKSLNSWTVFVDSDLKEIDVPITTIPIDYDGIKKYLLKFIFLLDEEIDDLNQKRLVLKDKVMEEEGKVEENEEDINDFMSAFLRFVHWHLPSYPTGIFTVLADTTDENLCSVALSTYNGEILDEDSTYTKFVNEEMRHTQAMFGEDNYPWNSKTNYTYRKENAHEMFVFDKYFGKVTGDCYAQAIFNEAVFRLWGFEPDKTFMLSIGGDKNGHIINLVSLNNEWFLFDSVNYIMPIFRGGYFDYFKYLRGFFNEGLYTIFADYFNMYPSKSNMSLDEIKAIANSAKSLFKGNLHFGSGVNHKEKIDDFTPFSKFENVVDRSLKTTIFDAIPTVPENIKDTAYYEVDSIGDFFNLTYKKRQELLESASIYLSLLAYDEILKDSINHPTSQYTLSRYAMQTVRVKNPEAYARGAIYAARTVELLVKGFNGKTMSDMLDFVIKELNEIELLGPSSLFEYPDMTLFIKKGNPYSRSLFAYALLYNLFYNEKDLYILWGPSGEGYISFVDNKETKYIDCNGKEVKIIDKRPENIWVEFNIFGHKFFNLPPILKINGSIVKGWRLVYNRLNFKDKEKIKLIIEDPNWIKTEKVISISDDLLKTEYKDVYDRLIKGKNRKLLTLDSPALSLSTKSNKINSFYKEVDIVIDFNKLEEGGYYIPISVSNDYGHSGLYIYSFSFGFNFEKDTSPPVLFIEYPEDNSYTNRDTITIKGLVLDFLSGVDRLTVNDEEITLKDNGIFEKEVTLSEGENKIEIEAYDKAGNKTTKTFTVNYIKRIILKLQIGNKVMLVNDTPLEIDVPPTIVEGRTLLPIRWVAEPLGAEVGWDGKERKVTVSLNDTTIELWIGKPLARVNGIEKPIDPNNPRVVPMIINGRTMLPVRFVAENLGADVLWDGATKTVTIIYPKE